MRPTIWCLVATMMVLAVPVLADDVVSAPAEVTAGTVAVDPVVAPTDAIGEDATAGDVADGVQKVVEGVKAGEWSAIAGGLIFLLVALFKLPLLGGLIRKIPARWRILIVLVLGAASGCVAAIAGGMSWYEAVYVWLFSSSSGVFAHDLFVESLFGGKSPA